MKREELKELGLNDEQLEAVIKLHGQSIEGTKSKFADYDELKTANESLTKQVEQSTKDLKKLSKLTSDNEELNKTVEDLRTASKEAQEKAANDIKALKLDNAINSGLANAKARNNKAVKSLLDMEAIQFNDEGKLEGLEDQLTEIAKDNGFLFDKGTTQDYTPKGNEGGGVSDKAAFLNEWN